MRRGRAADTFEGWLHDAVQASNRGDAQHYLKLLTTRLADQRTEEQLYPLSSDPVAKQKRFPSGSSTRIS